MLHFLGTASFYLCLPPSSFSRRKAFLSRNTFCSTREQKERTKRTKPTVCKGKKERQEEKKEKERKGKKERKQKERKKKRKKKEQGTRIPKPILLLLFSVSSLFLFFPSLSCLFLYFLSFSTSLLRIFLITWPFSYYTSCYVPLSFVSRYCRTYKKNALSGGGA